MAALAGKNGRVYAAPLLVEDCEDTWNETVVGGVALSTTTGKVGNAARATTTTVGATTLLMSEVISKNLTGYDLIAAWIKSSVNTATGDLRLQLDDNASCVSPIENLQIPALTAATWRLCAMRLNDPTLLASLISIGLYQNADLADGTFDVDAVYALAEVDGINKWSLKYTSSTGDVTDFQSDGVSEFIGLITSWSGSFSGNKDGAPQALGDLVYLVLGESKTNTQNWTGAAIITSVSAETSFDGVVTYSYDFQGTGVLEVVTT